MRSAAARRCPSREDRERAGLIGDCVMTCFLAAGLQIGCEFGLFLCCPEGETPSGPPPGEDREQAGLIGDCVMTSPPALALSPYGGAAAAGRKPRERLRIGVRSAI